jgi:hypothetical protein
VFDGYIGNGFKRLYTWKYYNRDGSIDKSENIDSKIPNRTGYLFGPFDP